MYGLKQRRLEKDRLEWYKCHGQKPPSSGTDRRRRPKTKADTQTYTTTTLLNVYAPNQPEIRGRLSYWEGEGAGIEPVEFFHSINSLRGINVVSREKYPIPKTREPQTCFTPYQNDLVTFEAFEDIRKELKHKANHIASEMERVHAEWTREPDPDWIKMKGAQFSIEFSRFLELERREAQRKKSEKQRSKTSPLKRQFD